MLTKIMLDHQEQYEDIYTILMQNKNKEGFILTLNMTMCELKELAEIAFNVKIDFSITTFYGLGIHIIGTRKLMICSDSTFRKLLPY